MITVMAIARALFSVVFLLGGFGLQFYAQDLYFIQRKRGLGILINFLGFILMIISLIFLI